MPRLRAKHLPHRVTATRLLGEGSEGDTWAAPDTDLPAYVEQKQRMVIDRRPTSETFGEQILADTFVVILTQNDVLPRSLVKVHEGTPRERESEVITSQLFDYNARTPNHVELWLL